MRANLAVSFVVLGLFAVECAGGGADHKNQPKWIYPLLASVDDNQTITAAMRTKNGIKRLFQPGPIGRWPTRECGIMYAGSGCSCSFGYGCVWVSGYTTLGPVVRRVPMDELKFYDINNPDFRSDFKKKYPKEHPLHLFSHTWYMNPLAELNFAIARENAFGAKVLPQLSFDFLPTGKNSGKIFVHGSGGFSVWNAKMKMELAAEWERLDRVKFTAEKGIRAELHAPFHVFAKEKDYFFLNAGKLYAYAKDGKTKMRAVWEKSEQPILAAITYTAKKKTYFFGRNKKKHPFVFALSREINVVHVGTRPLLFDENPSPLYVAAQFVGFLRQVEKE